jgi:hypothetical protein
MAFPGQGPNTAQMDNVVPVQWDNDQGLLLVGGGRAIASLQSISPGNQPSLIASLVTTWAARPTTGLWVGLQAMFTDIGIGPGVLMWWTGSAWKPFSPQTIAVKSNITSGSIQTGDQVVGQLGPMPAGLLVGQVFVLRCTIGRNNNTDAFGSATTLRLGTTGTVADTPIGSQNISSTFPAGSGALSSGFENWSQVVTSTSVVKLGTANAGPSFTAVGSGAAIGSSAAVSNLSISPSYLSVTTTMGAATTTTPQTGYMELVLMPSA